MKKDAKYYLSLLKTAPDGDSLETKVEKFDRFANTLLIASLVALVGLAALLKVKKVDNLQVADKTK